LYRGGRKITDFRGGPPAWDREPELCLGGHHVERYGADTRLLVTSVLTPAADPYFVFEPVALDREATIDPGFTVLVVPDAEAEADGEVDCAAAHVSGASTAAAHGFGDIRLRGRAELLAGRPPSPDSPSSAS
jgi:hypothetical protein